jgi:flagellar motility protein MotE (MotC chaperone)
MSKLISEQVKKTEFLISGLRNNKEVVKSWWIDAPLVDELEAEKNVLDKANQELERLKAEFSERSKAATQKLELHQKKFIEVKKKVKSNTDPAKWLQFGVMDKR